MASPEPARQEPGLLRRVLCAFGVHRPERIERVAGSDELQLVVCETCGSRRMRHRPEPQPDADWGPRR
jgi:hypothetical protein